jgi:hypothetical protein
MACASAHQTKQSLTRLSHSKLGRQRASVSARANVFTKEHRSIFLGIYAQFAENKSVFLFLPAADSALRSLLSGGLVLFSLTLF